MPRLPEKRQAMRTRFGARTLLPHLAQRATGQRNARHRWGLAVLVKLGRKSGGELG